MKTTLYKNRLIVKKLREIAQNINDLILMHETDKVTLTGKGELKNFISNNLISNSVIYELGFLENQTITQENKKKLSAYLKTNYPSYEINNNSLYKILQSKHNFCKPQFDIKGAKKLNQRIIKEN